MNESGPSRTYSLSAVVDRFDGKYAVMKMEDGQEVRWPVKQIPDDLHEGSAVRILLSTAPTEEKEREALARTMLNDLLKRAE